MKALMVLLAITCGACVNIGALQTAPGAVANVSQQTRQGIDLPRPEPKQERDELALLRDVCKGRAWSYTPATSTTPSKAFCR